MVNTMIMAPFTITLLIASFFTTAMIILLIIMSIRSAHHKEITKIAYTDPITGYSNYIKFKLDAEEILRNKKDRNYVLVFSDVEQFSYINDTYGYATGDGILCSLLSTVIGELKVGELAARRSSDNFVYLLEYENKSLLLERLSFLHHKCNEMSMIKDKRYTIFMKRGIYIIPEMTEDFSVIVGKAEQAHKTIQGLHCNTVVFYNDALHKELLHEKALENSIASSLERNEFIVHLQPKIDLQTKDIVGAEALVRWQHNVDGLLNPDQFIPLFESNGFILDLDFYVYRKVCQLLRRWINEEKRLVPISVNVSRVHISNKEFSSSFKEIVDAYDIPTNLIELELTENIFLKNVADAFTMIGDLKEMGFSISIDDFGSGYSSLNLLKDLPVDILKLDKGFFKAEGLSEKDKFVVSGIINIAKNLNLQVLSEGVETDEQSDFLRNSKCDMAQGYLFARPMPIVEFEALLAQSQPELVLGLSTS